eukprot:CAMPEP_0198208836 /NCGR_PEP_ID=MMETSP1445-20131203/12178_1 /TAXON_ID=36898 /ORGANISM="Pyramimonas sp., Strain CCMP2087" /LENGTH=71 /DNA_ID=CAMNT_0043882391 /DNA_START=49 /DNA_END=260 /DNA_ORIENTATION=+
MATLQASTVQMKTVAFQRGQLRTNRAAMLSKPTARCVTARRVLSVNAADHPTKVGVLMGSPNDLPKMKGAV